jgi:tRNA pseudouridine55 synthase
MTLPELLLIDKPTGVTSFGVIRELRKRTGIRKFGHAGTLDPAASGLMLIGVEQGTKRLSDLQKLDKEYVTEIAFGEQRSTGDSEGEIVLEMDITEIDEAAVAATVESMVGTLRLPVSAYSAIKKGGVPMYKRARAAAVKGETIEDVPVRDMDVYAAELLGIYQTELQGKIRWVAKVRFHVGSGTYIRSLGEELGRRLGYPATLASLRRTKVGEYDIADARQLSDF